MVSARFSGSSRTVRALAGDSALLSRARYLLGVILSWTSIPSRAEKGGDEILLVASCCRNRDKPQPDKPLGSYADLTCYPTHALVKEACSLHHLN